MNTNLVLLGSLAAMLVGLTTALAGLRLAGPRSLLTVAGVGLVATATLTCLVLLVALSLGLQP